MEVILKVEEPMELGYDLELLEDLNHIFWPLVWVACEGPETQP